MTQQDAPCPHHWIIETANGPSSKGVCRLCHEERQFENAPHLDTWVQLQERQRRAKDADAKEEEQP